MNDLKRTLTTLWLCDFIERLIKWLTVSVLIIIPIVAAMKTGDIRFLWSEIATTIAACVVGVEKKDAG